MGKSQDIRPGNIIKFNGENHLVLEYEHRTPGNLPAHHQVKMRNLRTGRLQEQRFRTGENIEFVRVERNNYQYLYRDENTFYFMDMATYDQIPVDINNVGDSVPYLKENQEVIIAFEGSEVLAVELPPHVYLRVTHTEPGFKGDTATNVLKLATMETGTVIQVPLFINEDDLLRVDTRTGQYIERVKE